MNSISTAIRTPGKHFASVWNGTALSNALRLLQRQPRFVQTLGILGLFVLIAWFDFFIDRNLSLFALYLIPLLSG